MGYYEKSEYQLIVESLTPERVKNLLYELGAVDVEEQEGYLVTNTICHNVDANDASKKLYFYKDNKFFYCYTNCLGMSIFRFLENYYNTREIDYNWYFDVFEVAKACSTVATSYYGILPIQRIRLESIYARREREVELPTYNNEIIEVFANQHHPLWISEGISHESMDRYNIRYSFTHNKIVIPHYNVEGKLIGIRGRALEDEEINTVGKYMPMEIAGKYYSHPLSLTLYGLNVSAPEIRREGYVYVFEGEKSSLLVDSFSMPNCSVAVCGSNFNKYQLNLLLKEVAPKEIIICFDKEEKEKENTYFNKLMSLCRKFNMYCNFSFIYDTQNLLELKDSPVDKGQAVFEQLLANRIQVK